VIAHLAN